MVRKSIVAFGIVLALMIGTGIVLGIRRAQRDAARNRAFGRLSQLHLALANYEHQHGSIPSRFVKNADGKATHSWLAFVLPQFEESGVWENLDVTAPWDAHKNSDAVNLGEQFWQWYRKDGFFPCTLQSEASIWTDSGAPRGKMSQFPNSIVLIAVEQDDVHPLQPFAITDDQLGKLLMDGKEALFIDSNRVYGRVRLPNGEIVYER